jgi:hypothetical protein
MSGAVLTVGDEDNDDAPSDPDAEDEEGDADSEFEMTEVTEPVRNKAVRLGRTTPKDREDAFDRKDTAPKDSKASIDRKRVGSIKKEDEPAKKRRIVMHPNADDNDRGESEAKAIYRNQVETLTRESKAQEDRAERDRNRAERDRNEASDRAATVAATAAKATHELLREALARNVQQQPTFQPQPLATWNDPYHQQRLQQQQGGYNHNQHQQQQLLQQHAMPHLPSKPK